MKALGRVDAQVGSRIGGYQLIERIGGGVVSLVFRARSAAHDRDVALKVIAADLQDDPEARERFLREASIMAGLRHPNIVSVLDAGEDNGRPYLVMELLDGQPLDQYLREPKATLSELLDLMIQMLEGLQAAHAHDVVHRDIKPSNVFVGRDRVVRILDFGLARLQASTLTASGAVVGTPAFMSPEQAEGRQVDARSDIFSAAAVGYFMLTRRSPFAAADLPRTLHALLHEDPAPITETPVSEPLSRVLATALAKSPERRYQRCADLLADVRECRRAVDTSVRAGAAVPGVIGRGPELRRRIAAFAGMVGL